MTPAPMTNPAPESVRNTRVRAGVSQLEASQMVRSGLRTWQQWEAGDRHMHAGLWELFLIKIRHLKARRRAEDAKADNGAQGVLL